MVTRHTAFVALFVAGVLLLSMQAAAVDVSQTSGGSVVTNLAYGIAVNEDSSLNRMWYVLNSPESPVQLANAGIAAIYDDGYSFSPRGEIRSSGDVMAFEVRFLLFDMFGRHMKTLAGTEVSDLPSGASLDLSETGAWRAWEYEVGEFLTSVVFVAQARLADGHIWRADMAEVQAAIAGIKLELTEEELSPTPRE